MPKQLRVLIACEYSGATRDAFRKLGHYALSCDLLPTDVDGPHYQGDVFDIINDGWDLMVAHPPCTYLTVAGVRWLYHPEDRHLPTAQRRRHPNYPNRLQDQEDGLAFVQRLMGVDIPAIAIENPVSVISSRIRKPDQVIQPWMFGHGETKATCLWLKNLPKLVPTNVVEGREQRIHLMPPGPLRWKERSKTFQGIADAFAAQWSAHLTA
jgi:hypothetical protein